MTIGFFPQDEQMMLSEAATKAFSSGQGAATSVDALACLLPIGSEIDLVSACVLVRQGARHTLDYPLAEAFALATLLHHGGSADDLRAAFGSRLGDKLVGAVPIGTARMLVLDAGKTTLGSVNAKGPASDPLQNSAWVTAMTDPQHFDRDLRAIAWTLVSARILGAAEAVLDRAVTHLAQRRQFGRLLGTFQTLRHRAAEDWIRIQDISAAVDLAAAAFDRGAAEDALACARIAKATASAQGPRVAENAIHAHGAMGFTWDTNLHPFLVSIRHDAAILGTASQHYKHIGAARIAPSKQEGLAP
jgi:hypothetical protein